MEPAQTIITKLGGVSVVAAALGVHRTRVSNWQRPREKGGTGGLVPQRHHRALLDFALERGKALTAEEFLPPLKDAPSTGEPREVETEGVGT
jgi:hypothetical protein